MQYGPQLHNLKRLVKDLGLLEGGTKPIEAFRTLLKRLQDGDEAVIEGGRLQTVLGILEAVKQEDVDQGSAVEPDQAEYSEFSLWLKALSEVSKAKVQNTLKCLVLAEGLGEKQEEH